MNTGNRIYKVLKIFTFSITACLLAIVIFVYVSYRSMSGCALSDHEAMSKAREFAGRFNIPYDNNPIIETDPYLNVIEERGFSIKYFLFEYVHYVTDLTLDPIKKKKVVFDGFEVEVSCDSKDVVYYNNPSLRSIADERYTAFISDEYGNKVAVWSEFTAEEKVKKIVDSIASTLNLPEDMVFEELSKDKESDLWRGIWRRYRNGYPYDNDALSIGVIGVTGDLVSYYKSYWGTECPTEIKIDKEEAIDKGIEKLKFLVLDENDKKKFGDVFEVKNIELRIVQPQTILGIPGGFKSKNSRLAWVIEYNWKPDITKISTKDEQDLIPYRSQRTEIIWIDAGTGKYLGSLV